MIVNLEMMTAIVISFFFRRGVLLSSILMFSLVFFVREALILLRSFFRRLRSSGVSYGRLSF